MTDAAARVRARCLLRALGAKDTPANIAAVVAAMRDVEHDAQLAQREEIERLRSLIDSGANMVGRLACKLAVLQPGPSLRDRAAAILRGPPLDGEAR